MNTLSVFRSACAKIKKTVAATIASQFSAADDSLPLSPGVRAGVIPEFHFFPR
jgi:hypothetical protein